MQKGLKRIALGLVTVGLSITLLLTGAMPVCEAGPDERVVKIGMHAIYTGALADTGVPVGQAVQDYISYVNERGGVNGVRLEYKWYDIGKQLLIGGISAYKRLREEGAIIQMTIADDAAKVLIRRLVRDESPMMLITAYTPGIVAKPPWVFTSEPSTRDLGALFARQIKEVIFADLAKERPVRVGMLLHDHLGGWEALEGLRWGCEHLGRLELVGYEVVPVAGAIDTSTEWLRLVRKNPDIVWVTCCGGTLVTVVKDSVRLGVKQKGIKFIHSDYCMKEVMPIIGVEAAEGWLCHEIQSSPMESELPGMKIILEAAKKYRGRSPEDIPTCYVKMWILTSVAVEGIRLAIEKVGYENLTGRAVRDGLASISDFDTGGVLPEPITLSDTHPWMVDGAMVYEFRQGNLWPFSKRVVEYPAGFAEKWLEEA